jgi:hypothetical protein
VDEERRYEPQAHAECGPRESEQTGRRHSVVKPGVQREKATPKKKGDCEAQEKENALEVSLPAMAEDDHHPEEWQQRSSRQHNQAEVEHPIHTQSRKVYRQGKSKAIAKCKENLAPKAAENKRVILCFKTVKSE